MELTHCVNCIVDAKGPYQLGTSRTNNKVRKFNTWISPLQSDGHHYYTSHIYGHNFWRRSVYDLVTAAYHWLSNYTWASISYRLVIGIDRDNITREKRANIHLRQLASSIRDYLDLMNSREYVNGASCSTINLHSDVLSFRKDLFRRLGISIVPGERAYILHNLVS